MAEQVDPVAVPAVVSIDRERIVLEEQLRSEIRESLAKAKPREKGFLGLMANDGFKWLVTAIAIPITTLLWTQHQKELADKGVSERAQNLKEELDRKEKIADEDRKARERIETAQRNVGLALQFVPSLSKAVGDPERRFALTVLRSLREEGRLPDYIHVAYEEAVSQLRLARTTANVLLERESVTARVLVNDGQGSAPDSSIKLPAAVGNIAFIQIFEESQREPADRLRKVLRGEGVAAPGIENVVATKKKQEAPKGYDGNVIIVFKEGDRATATRIVNAAKAERIQLSIRDRTGLIRFANVPAGHLEVWFRDPSVAAPSKNR